MSTNTNTQHENSTSTAKAQSGRNEDENMNSQSSHQDESSNQGYPDDFKKKVVRESYREEVTSKEVAEKYGVSPSSVSVWRGDYPDVEVDSDTDELADAEDSETSEVEEGENESTVEQEAEDEQEETEADRDDLDEVSESSDNEGADTGGDTSEDGDDGGVSAEEEDELDEDSPESFGDGGEAVVLDIHPAVEDLPRCSDDTRENLKASIEANGLKEPIVVDKQDRIIDGRARWNICQKADVEVKTRTIDIEDDQEVRARWNLLNIERRQMNKAQQAAYGAEILFPRAKEAARRRQEAGANQHRSLSEIFPEGIPGLDDEENFSGSAREHAAKPLDCSGRSIEKAAKIKKADADTFHDMLDGAYDSIASAERNAGLSDDDDNGTPISERFVSYVSLEDEELEQRLKATVGNDEEKLNEVVKKGLELYFHTNESE